MSMVAVGGLFVGLEEPLAVAEGRSGAKAEARRAEMSEADQVAVMLSGKRDGSSTTKTSASLRRPRRRALAFNSFLRMWPRPAASPISFNFFG